VAELVRAYESGDPDALVALLTDDVFVSMPPIPLEHRGRDVVARLFASIFGSGRRVDLVPTLVAALAGVALDGDPYDRALRLAARTRLDPAAMWEWGVTEGVHCPRLHLRGPPAGRRGDAAAADHIAATSG
jgi:hypothetical protein